MRILPALDRVSLGAVERTALVTGAGPGIGLETALALSRSGFAVTGAGHPPALLAERRRKQGGAGRA